MGSRRHSPHRLSSKGPIYQRGVLLGSADAIEEHFEGKPRGKITKAVLFLHENAPAHRALATQKKLAHCPSSIMITHPILRIYPCRTTTGSLD